MSNLDDKRLLRQKKQVRTDDDRFVRGDSRVKKSGDYLRVLAKGLFGASPGKTTIEPRLLFIGVGKDTTEKDVADAFTTIANGVRDEGYDYMVKTFNDKSSLSNIRGSSNAPYRGEFDDSCVPFVRPITFSVVPDEFRSVFDSPLNVVSGPSTKSTKIGGSGIYVYNAARSRDDANRSDALIAAVGKMSRSIRHFISFVKKGADQSGRLSANFKFRCIDVRGTAGFSVEDLQDAPAITFFGSRDKVVVDILMPTVTLEGLKSDKSRFAKMIPGGLTFNNGQVTPRSVGFYSDDKSSDFVGTGCVMITPGCIEWTWESFRQAFRIDKWVSRADDDGSSFSRADWDNLFTPFGGGRQGSRESRIRPDSLAILTRRTGTYFDAVMGHCTSCYNNAPDRKVDAAGIYRLPHPVTNFVANDIVNTFISPVDLLLLVESDWFQRNYVNRRGQKGLTLSQKQLVKALKAAYTELASYHGWQFDDYYDNLNADFPDDEVKKESFVVDDLHDKITLRTTRS